MKINSRQLFDFINKLKTNEKVRFKVYYDDNYLTEIIWDGENFSWEPGTFTSGAFFNLLYDFEVIEDKPKKIEELNINLDKFNDSYYDTMLIALYDQQERIRQALNHLLEKSDKE